MIENNERHLVTLQFAYKWEVEALDVRMHALEQQILRNTRTIESLQKPRDKKQNEPIGYSDKHLAEMIYSHKNELLNHKGILSSKRIRVVFMHKLGVNIGHNRAYTIKELLRLMHPDEFA